MKQYIKREQIKSKDDADNREQSLEPDSLQLTIEAALKKKNEEHLNDDESERIKAKDDTDGQKQSPEPDSLQLTIEAALKKKNEEHLNVEIERTDPDQTDTTITSIVEINHTTEESKDDAEDRKKQNMSVEFDCQQNLTTNSHLMVDVETTDEANVEFSTADKHNSSFMVTLEETSPSPPPELTDTIKLEGRYRNDSIIPNNLGPAAQYLLEKTKQDETVSATAINVEVYTPTSNPDEARAEITEYEMNKVTHVETSSGNDIEVAVKVETSHSDFVDI